MKKSYPTSIYFLLTANAVPLAGVLFFGWDLIDVLFLYWAETVIIGFYSLLKIFLAKDDDQGWRLILTKFMRVLGCAFFIIHFGGFIAAIGVALYYIVLELFKVKVDPLELAYMLRYALLFFILSHGYSFIFNYLLKNERNVERGQDPVIEPYRRVFVMHLTLAFGMGPVIFLGQPIYLLIALIVMKTIADLWSHLRERKRFRSPSFA
ncbi:MAG: DUF6498-containing protein [Pseudomonadota bacterium]